MCLCGWLFANAFDGSGDEDDMPVRRTRMKEACDPACADAGQDFGDAIDFGAVLSFADDDRRTGCARRAAHEPHESSDGALLRREIVVHAGSVACGEERSLAVIV